MKTATPAGFTFTVARTTPLTAKATWPVGVGPPGDVGVTVAVKVTACPKADGLAEEVTAVAVPRRIVCWRVPVLARKLPSPEYSAVMVRVPIARVFGFAVNVALVTPPTVLRVPVPSKLPSTRKVTVPVGPPRKAGETVAVKVTAWSTPDGLSEAVTVVVVEAWLTSVSYTHLTLPTKA